jgi:hypothetical protein
MRSRACRHRFRVVVLTTLVVLLTAAPAHAGSASDSWGGTSARLSWDGPRYDASNLQIEIERSGEAFGGSVDVPGCDPAFSCGPTFSQAPVRVRDIDGNGEPDVVLNLYSGGAHCCFIGVVYRYRGGDYRRSYRNFGNPGFRLQDLYGDGRREFVSADNRFAYRFASYASSGMPILVLRYAHGRFINETRRHRRLVRKDAHYWWKQFRSSLRRYGKAEARGHLAAWAADRYLVRRRHRALRKMRTLARKGEVGGGLRFIRRLDRFLRSHGY